MKHNNSETMKLEETNYDAMIRILKKQMEEGTNPQATPEVFAQLQHANVLSNIMAAQGWLPTAMMRARGAMKAAEIISASER